MNIQNQAYSSIDQIREQFTQTHSDTKSKKIDQSNANSFQAILAQKEGIRFSKHASERIASRNINLSEEQQERLANAADMASEKGMNESLVMVDDMAFIVNAKTKMVVTAVDQVSKGVFTNIDGAIIN